MSTTSSLELRTKITSEARLELWLEQVTVPNPAAGRRRLADDLEVHNFCSEGVRA
jgi:hypothetical protein